MRKFEVVTEYLEKDIVIPARSTSESAGYDFQASEDVVIESIFKKFDKYKSGDLKTEEGKLPSRGTLVPTGIKADMPSGEFLALYSRSSNFNKVGLILANSVGVIDKDYYNNPENEGHIFFNFINLGFEDVIIRKGQAIGQGVFTHFEITENDESKGTRVGGWGSTDK